MAKDKPEKAKPSETRNVQVRFSAEEGEALELFAKREYRNTSSLVRAALAEYAKARGFKDWPEA